MKRTIKIKAVLPYPPELVWKALTNSEILGMWFMKNNIQAVEGAEFQFQMASQKGWDGITHCQIIRVDPLKHISYSYKGEATGEKALACAGIHSETADKAGKVFFTKLDTKLTFDLSPTFGGTIVMLRQSGYSGLLQVVVSYIMQMGWKKQLKKRLPSVLSKIHLDEA